MLETLAMWVGLIGGAIAIIGVLIRIWRCLRGRFLNPRKIWAKPKDLSAGEGHNHGMIVIVNPTPLPIYQVYERVEWGGREATPDRELDELPPGKRATCMVHFGARKPNPETSNYAPVRIWLWWTDQWGRRWHRDPDGQVGQVEPRSTL